MSYTITRTGSNIILKYGSDVHSIWQMGNFNVFVNETADNNITLGNEEFKIKLDYTNCTTPSGATTKYDLMEKICAITNINDNTDYGLVDSGNSSTTPLASDAIFTGTWIDVSDYSEFTCVVTTDVSGTLNMDISTNGVDIDRSKQVNMNTGGAHSLVIISQYMRIRYTNDSVAQNHFRIQTIFHKFKSKELTSTSSQVISDQSDVQLVRTVNDNTLDLSRGVISDKKASLFFGRNPSVGTSDEDIWSYSGNYNFLIGATTLEVMSNNAEDDSTGLGCRSVLINGLDSNCNELSEIIALTGNGTVTTTNSYLRLQSAYVATCGTNRGSNYNDICIQSTGSALKVGCIGGGYGTINTASYGIGRTQLGIYTVPAGKTLYITSMYVNVDNSKTANIGLYTVSNIDNTTPPTSPRIMLAKIDNMSDFREKELKSYFAILEKTDIWYRGSVNSGTAGVDVQMEYFLVDN
jgi:hypothetical protein